MASFMVLFAGTCKLTELVVIKSHALFLPVARQSYNSHSISGTSADILEKLCCSTVFFTPIFMVQIVFMYSYRLHNFTFVYNGKVKYNTLAFMTGQFGVLCSAGKCYVHSGSHRFHYVN